MNEVLLSVILPVYNGETFIKSALDSILAQNYRPLEIIVVDDGSTDDTARIVNNLGIDLCYLYQSNQGPAAARNRGLELARGALLAFQDVDDLWAPGRLARQMALLARTPEVLAVIGKTRFFYSENALLDPTETDLAPPGWFLGIHSGLYRRACFEKIGHFDPALRYHEDIDWFRRARAGGLTIRSQEQVVLFHRRHAHNMTNEPTALQLDWLRMLRQERSRANGSLLTWITGNADNS